MWSARVPCCRPRPWASVTAWEVKLGQARAWVQPPGQVQGQLPEQVRPRGLGPRVPLRLAPWYADRTAAAGPAPRSVGGYGSRSNRQMGQPLLVSPWVAVRQSAPLASPGKAMRRWVEPAAALLDGPPPS